MIIIIIMMMMSICWSGDKPFSLYCAGVSGVLSVHLDPNFGLDDKDYAGLLF